MKRIQNFYLYSYRLTGFIFLTGLIASILWYGFTVIFFICSSSWSVPMILSPNQEKVMSHLEHLLNIEQQLSKNQVELKAAQKALFEKKKILNSALTLEERVAESMISQSVLYAKNSLELNKITNEKKQNLVKLNNLANELKLKETTIDNELKLGLITKQEALVQQISLNNVRSSLVDAKTKVHELQEQVRHFSSAASTLNGTGSNLLAMHKVVKKAELHREISDLKVDTYALTESIKALKQNVDKRQHALAIMKKSPYILATKGLITVAFVPYGNLNRVTIGNPVYSCYLDMILCYKAGQVTAVYKAEEYGSHPIFKSETKGQFIRIAFINKKDAQKKLLFLNSKPLLV